MKLVLVIFSTLVLSIEAYSEVKIDVKLNPAGSFVAETKKIRGYAYKTKTGVAAENVEVDVNSITTGMSLRDKHLKERLDSKKFPKAKLIKAVGKNGSGKAKIEIKGIQKIYSGKYTVDGENLKASFEIDLEKDLNIKDVSYMSVGVNDKIVVNITLPLKNR